ncbi:MAG TPA: DegV family protein [Anaerolineaceae bacterium]|nr:DegV family protein [Anaerolineaceae bacterium]
MIRIATDSSADFPEGWVEAYDINILPINITHNGVSYLQGVNIDNDLFYQLVYEDHTIPKTSLPSPQQIMNFYRRIGEQGDTIFSIHVSSKLSGTVNAVEEAARGLEGEFNVIPVDSLSGSAMMAFMCKEVRLMERAGASIQEILDRLEHIRKTLFIVFTVDNLEFARLSGRVNSLQATLSSVLQIKPMIQLKDGLLYATERVRTRRYSLDRILELVRQRMGNRKINLAVVHARDPETGRSLLERAMNMFNCCDVFLAELSISVAAHLGPRTIGIVAYPVEER